MLGYQAAAINHILLCDANKHIFERDQFGRVALFDLLEVVAEASLGRAPVSHRESVRLAGSFELGLIPIQVE